MKLSAFRHKNGTELPTVTSKIRFSRIRNVLFSLYQNTLSYHVTSMQTNLFLTVREDSSVSLLGYEPDFSSHHLIKRVSSLTRIKRSALSRPGTFVREIRTHKRQRHPRAGCPATRIICSHTPRDLFECARARALEGSGRAITRTRQWRRADGPVGSCGVQFRSRRSLRNSVVVACVIPVEVARGATGRLLLQQQRRQQRFGCSGATRNTHISRAS